MGKIGEMVGLEESANSSLLSLPTLLAAERNEISYSYNYTNSLNSGNAVINNARSQVDLLLPLEQKGGLAISANMADAFSRLGLNQYNFAWRDKTSSVALFYGARLTDHLDVGAGVSQDRINVLSHINDSVETTPYPIDSRRNSFKLFLGTSFGERLKFNICNNRAGVSSSPNDSGSGNITDTKENSELMFSFNFNDKTRLKGKYGWGEGKQGWQLFNQGALFSDVFVSEVSSWGSLGAEWQVGGNIAEFNFITAGSALSGQGSLYAQNLPNLLSNVSNVDKSANLDGKLRLGGCQFGFSGGLIGKLRLETNWQYLMVLMEGDADVWNKLFFGAISQLENSYLSPASKIDCITGNIGLRYPLSDLLEISYKYNQLIPIRVEGNNFVSTGDGTAPLSGSSNVSGGNIQTLAVKCFF